MERCEIGVGAAVPAAVVLAGFGECAVAMRAHPRGAVLVHQNDTAVAGEVIADLSHGGRPDTAHGPTIHPIAEYRNARPIRAQQVVRDLGKGLLLALALLEPLVAPPLATIVTPERGPVGDPNSYQALQKRAEVRRLERRLGERVPLSLDVPQRRLPAGRRSRGRGPSPCCTAPPPG